MRRSYAVPKGLAILFAILCVVFFIDESGSSVEVMKQGTILAGVGYFTGLTIGFIAVAFLSAGPTDNGRDFYDDEDWHYRHRPPRRRRRDRSMFSDN